jgi:enamine deaminase RidA (YjgF/YER057c/UK114 family)
MTTSIRRLHPAARYSEASIHGGTVYLAGQVASNGATTIEGQTADVLAQIDRLLAEAGSSKERILMANVFLADMADFAGMNTAWDAWVAPGQAPSRATVEARLAKPEWKVEIVVTAALA